MKLIKNCILLFILFFCVPFMVHAGSISFNNPKKTSSNTYQFTLTVDDMKLNYINGRINITNGTISKVTMSSGWKNKTGMNNTFYFYHDGESKGAYTVATIEVTMTGNSEYNIENLSYGLNKCIQDNYGTYFGENGSIVSKIDFDATCGISKDATLKSLSISNGTLSPNFSSALEIYSASVDSSVNMVTFHAVPTHAKAKVLSGQTCSLKTGLNTCKIVIKAEAGNTKTYTITIVKEKDLNSTPVQTNEVSNFVVHNGTLNREFDLNVKEYTITPNKNAQTIYFTFMTDNGKIAHTSDSCSTKASSCQLMFTTENGAKKYSFTFHILENSSSNDATNNPLTNSNSNNKNNNIISNNNKNTNKNTSTTNKTQTPNRVNEDENNKVEEEEIINPITTDKESNKNFEDKKENKINQESKKQFVPKEEKKRKENLLSLTAILCLFIGGVIGVTLANHKK